MVPAFSVQLETLWRTFAGGERDFSRIDLAGADLHHWQLNQIVLWGANLARVNFAKARLRYAILTDACLENANLTQADLRGADLRGAVLTGARLQKTLLDGAVYSHDTQFPAGFLPERAGMVWLGPGVVLPTQDLRHRDFSGADLTAANLSGALLTQICLFGAGLRLANLLSALMGHSDLRYTDFHQATLMDADLRGANLSYANLTQANLVGANLSNCRLVGTQWQGALYSETTQFPTGFSAPTILRYLGPRANLTGPLWQRCDSRAWICARRT
jgi:uncharacterized protein YjbI with pentapeptide repeats